MITRLIKLDLENPDVLQIKEAASIICGGGLVSFPTETIYGLGANGLDEDAVKKIFLAKGRPQDNPLILHVASIDQVSSLVEEIPEVAKTLMEKFWPGPLTLIFKKSTSVPGAVTCGLDTVAIRMPKNTIALELIKTSRCPLAAPSANISGKPSPTTASHVMDDLMGKIDMVIDGGDVEIGLESTVLDITSTPPMILRPGKITREDLQAVFGDVAEQVKSEKPRSPGMKYTHYSPNAKVVIVDSQEELDAFLASNGDKKLIVLQYVTQEEMASNLFKDFRSSDKDGYELIVVRSVADDNFGRAIMDRLKKASSPK